MAALGFWGAVQTEQLEFLDTGPRAAVVDLVEQPEVIPAVMAGRAVLMEAVEDLPGTS